MIKFISSNFSTKTHTLYSSCAVSAPRYSSLVATCGPSPEERATPPAAARAGFPPLKAWWPICTLSSTMSRAEETIKLYWRSVIWGLVPPTGDSGEAAWWVVAGSSLLLHRKNRGPFWQKILNNEKPIIVFNWIVYLTYSFTHVLANDCNTNGHGVKTHLTN